jgi:hypothetical protein
MSSTRPAEDGEIQEGQNTGPRRTAAAAAAMTAEPAGDRDDEVWPPYHCSTCGEREHLFTTCRRPHN